MPERKPPEDDRGCHNCARQKGRCPDLATCGEPPTLWIQDPENWELRERRGLELGFCEGMTDAELRAGIAEKKGGE